MTEPQIIISCTDIRKTFSLGSKGTGVLEILKGINLTIHSGEIISVVGASGSGKSTLLHILGGLDKPTSGKVFWNDMDIATLGDEPLAKLRGIHVGFVFQFHHLLPEFTAMENVTIPLRIQGSSERAAVQRAEDLLVKVGLQDRMHHKPSELSGGEQQRVAVARALANSPRVIFADEPSGNLDSASSTHLHELLWELNKTEGQTFVIVTHNNLFAQQSHRVFRIHDGKLHQE
jgi:lipoprotein-releasing system ATP-binding protein